MEKCLVITNSNDEFLDRSSSDFLNCWNVKMPKNVDFRRKLFPKITKKY